MGDGVGRHAGRVALTAAACAGVLAIAGSHVDAQMSQAPVRVAIETQKGAIEIEVDVGRAPITAANFLRYLDAGLYDGGRFHRTVRPDTETNRETPIQVIQASRARGREGFPSIALERTSVTGLRHVDGAVSMARVAGQPDSATSDFFICIGDQPSLDFGGARNTDGQGFGVFGRVVKGMDVVRAIQASPVRPATQTLEPPIAIIRAVRSSVSPLAIGETFTIESRVMGETRRINAPPGRRPVALVSSGSDARNARSRRLVLVCSPRSVTSARSPACASRFALRASRRSKSALVAYEAVSRRREMAIRLALGATSRAVRSLIVAGITKPVLAGAVAGAAVAFGTSSYLAAFMYRVDASNPQIYATVVAGLGAIAAGASWLASLRSTRTDPAVALRSE